MGRDGGTAGAALALPLEYCAPHGQTQSQSGHGAVGQLSFPASQSDHGECVGHGGDAGEGHQGVHPHLEPQQLEQAPQQHINAQQHGAAQHARQSVHLELIGAGEHTGQRHAEERGQGEVDQGKGQQQHHSGAHPQELEPPGRTA